MLQPFYQSSWALIIGINDYIHAPPLGFACNDADSLASILVSEMGFLEPNITLLENHQATKQAIMDSYLDYSELASDPNDRILIFFAGHGMTITGHRGDVGYLVPFNGDPQKLNSLIRWDDLTRNSEMIPAKHMLFVIDACYSGLVLQRTVTPGAERFVSDMLQRPARQVITAGKADEEVADGGGPTGTNSIFTGHLIEGLSGAAAYDNGVITANGLMAYVYEKVGQDDRSDQTPHFGHFFADGDFIFKLPGQVSLTNELEKDYIVDSASSISEMITPLTDQISTVPSFAIRNNYIDPDNPNFGRNDWSDKLGEFRGSKNRPSETTKAFSWLSLIIEPLSSQKDLVNLKGELDRLSSYKPTSDEPYKRFMLPRMQITTVDSVIQYQQSSREIDLWERYLRVEQHGNIEYAEVYPVFYDWEGTRLFKFVQIIGLSWQFLYFAKDLLAFYGYDKSIRLLVNLVGTRETFLDDFSEETGEDNTKWRRLFDPMRGNSNNWICHNRNLQIEFRLALSSLDKSESKELIFSIGEKLGMAYNHQSSPRCFNYNTTTFPWNQFFRGRR